MVQDLRLIGIKTAITLKPYFFVRVTRHFRNYVDIVITYQKNWVTDLKQFFSSIKNRYRTAKQNFYVPT